MPNGSRPEQTVTQKQTAQQGSQDGDKKRRKDGFKSLFSRLTQTPEGNLALMQIGTTLMQGPRFGENRTALAGRALARGVNTFTRANQNKQAQQAAQAQGQRESVQAASEIAKNQAQAQKFRAQAQSEQVDARTQAQTGGVDRQKIMELRADIYNKAYERIYSQETLGGADPREADRRAKQQAAEIAQRAMGGFAPPQAATDQYIPQTDVQGNILTQDEGGRRYQLFTGPDGFTWRQKIGSVEQGE